MQIRINELCFHNNKIETSRCLFLIKKKKITKVLFPSSFESESKRRECLENEKTWGKSEPRPIQATLTFDIFNFDRISLSSFLLAHHLFLDIVFDAKMASSIVRSSITLCSTRPPHITRSLVLELSTLPPGDNPRISEFSIIVRYYPPRLWMTTRVKRTVLAMGDKFRVGGLVIVSRRDCLISPAFSEIRCWFCKFENYRGSGGRGSGVEWNWKEEWGLMANKRFAETTCSPNLVEFGCDLWGGLLASFRRYIVRIVFSKKFREFLKGEIIIIICATRKREELGIWCAICINVTMLR